MRDLPIRDGDRSVYPLGTWSCEDEELIIEDDRDDYGWDQNPEGGWYLRSTRRPGSRTSCTRSWFDWDGNPSGVKYLCTRKGGCSLDWD